ncbi:MAG: AAA family ATPase [Egibacteraceae bacterium]
MELPAAQEWDPGPSLLESVWRRRRMVLFVTILCGLIGFGSVLLFPSQYQATARLLLTNPGTTGAFRAELGEASVEARQYRDGQLLVMRSGPVEQRAAQLLGQGMTAEELERRVRVEASGEFGNVEVIASDRDPQRAAAIANAVVDAYQQVTGESAQARTDAAIAQLQQVVTDVQGRLADLAGRVRAAPTDTGLLAERDVTIERLAALEEKISQVRVDAAAFGSGVSFPEPALPPREPARRPVQVGLISAILGLLGATVLAFWRGERRVDALDPSDPASVIGAPLLGEIPEFRKAHARAPVPTVTHRASATAEAYQFVVASLRYALERHGGKTVLITSPVAGDGKTVTALNLAIAAGRDGRDVLLIDGDQRQRGLSRLCEVSDRPGLTDVAAGQSSVEEAVTECGLADPPVPSTIAAGSAVGDVAGFLRTVSFRRAMDQLKERPDLVLIDSPPLLVASDALSIAAHADGVVVVIRRGTPLRVLQEARQQLDRAGTPVLGYVFNRGDSRRPGYRYRYNNSLVSG